MDQLGIQPSVIIFQVVNFLILLYILKRFLYAPLLTMLEERKKNIEDVATMRTELEIKMSQMQQRQEELLLESRREAQLVLSQAKEQGDVLAQSIEKDAKSKAEEIIEKGKVEIEALRLRLREEISDEVASVALQTAEVVLVGKLTKEQKQEITKDAITRFNDAK